MFIYPVSERSPDCFLHSVEIGVHSPKEMVRRIAEGWAWKPRGCKMLPNHHTGAPIHQCRNLNTWAKGRRCSHELNSPHELNQLHQRKWRGRRTAGTSCRTEQTLHCWVGGWRLSPCAHPLTSSLEWWSQSMPRHCNPLPFIHSFIHSPFHTHTDHCKWILGFNFPLVLQQLLLKHS